MINFRTAIILTAGLGVTLLASAAPVELAPPVAATNTSAASSAAAMTPDTFKVFVDPTTGYAFVKTPTGWRFRGALSSEQLEHLPAGTYTRLVAPISVGIGS